MCIRDSVLGNLNVFKATGVDGISAGMLKLTAPAISSSICGIFNETLMMAEIPVEWRAARIVPIPKSTHAKCVEDFRPVSVLLVVVKVFESLASTWKCYTFHSTL